MEDVKAELSALEIDMFKLGTNDYDARLIGHLDPAFYEFASNGKTYTRADIIHDIEEKNNGDQKRKLTPADFKLQEIGAQLYLLTYRLSIQVENIEEPLRTVRSSIWSKASGTWLLRFHQATQQPET